MRLANLAMYIPYTHIHYNYKIAIYILYICLIYNCYIIHDINWQISVGNRGAWCIGPMVWVSSFARRGLEVVLRLRGFAAVTDGMAIPMPCNVLYK